MCQALYAYIKDPNLIITVAVSALTQCRANSKHSDDKLTTCKVLHVFFEASVAFNDLIKLLYIVKAQWPGNILIIIHKIELWYLGVHSNQEIGGPHDDTPGQAPAGVWAATTPWFSWRVWCGGPQDDTPRQTPVGVWAVVTPHFNWRTWCGGCYVAICDRRNLWRCRNLWLKVSQFVTDVAICDGKCRNLWQRQNMQFNYIYSLNFDKYFVLSSYLY